MIEPSGAAMMHVSDKGLMEIIGHEAIVLSPYYDSVGVLTIGIGHTKAAGGLDPAERWGKPLTVTEAIDLFRRDITEFSPGVRKAFTVPLTQEQFDAAVSFHFNTGSIDEATWVRNVNAGDLVKARKNFMNWRKPPEIIPRRTKERDLFFAGKYGDGQATIYPASDKGKVLWSMGEKIHLEPFLRPIPPPATPTPPEPRTPATGLLRVILAALAIVGAFIVALWNDLAAWACGFLPWC